LELELTQEKEQFEDLIQEDGRYWFFFIFLIVIVFDLVLSINVAYTTSISVAETLKNLNIGSFIVFVCLLKKNTIW